MNPKQIKLNVPEYNFLEKKYLECKKNKIPDVFKNYNKTKLYELNDNGYCILKNELDRNILDNIRNKFQLSIDNQSNVNRPRDLRHKSEEKENVYIPRLCDEDFNKGENFYRNFVDNIQLKDPLINIKDNIKLALNEKILSLVCNYFNCLPYLTYFKMVKSYANNYSSFDTQNFHIDENAIKLIKVFIYLNDVESDKDGPFCYVEKSHKNIRDYWGKKARWEDTEIGSFFPKKNITPIYAKKGDIIIANTVAFHKGLKPKNQDRNIIIMNYGLHQDYTIDNKMDITSNINNIDYEVLNNYEKKVFKLLNKI